MEPLDSLVAAALAGDESTVRAMVTDDPDLLDARTMFGVGAIHAARFGIHPEIVAVLEGLGQRTDAFLAAELGRVDALRAALAADPGPMTEVDGRGQTLPHAAVYWGQSAAARLLVEAGADVNAPTRDAFLRISPLGAAIATTPGVPQPSDDETTVLDVVRLPLAHGADVNARRADGMTPLHSAAYRGLALVARVLLDAGADPRATAARGPHDGQTPADTARAEGHLALAADLPR